MKQKIISIIGGILLLLSLIVIFAVSIHGIVGNPTEETLNDPVWKDEGSLELSPDRGRFALTYSVMENKSFHFSLPVATFAAPDVAFNDGKYLSLFAPALSFFVIPGYWLGKMFGVSQFGTFAFVSFIALINFFLVRSIVVALGGKKLAGTVAALAFTFGTPAFAYGVTLYQHHFTTLFLLLSVYAITKSKSLWATGLVWLLTTISVALDNPNAVFMLPVSIFAFLRLFEIEKTNGEIKLKFRYLGLLMVLLTVIPIGLYLLFNQFSNGNMFKLSGTLPTAVFETESTNIADLIDLDESDGQDDSGSKTVVGFFKTKNLINGIYTHTISQDRGTIFFAPIALFGIIGFFVFPKDKRNILSVIFATIGSIFVLYSLWGDPWGGWAFGSRYMIPAYSLMCVLLGIALSTIFKRWYVSLFFIAVFIFSIGVNTLGAITTNRNPPKVEAVALQEITKRFEKYSYDRNWEFLMAGRSKSFVYQTYLSNNITAEQFYYWVFGAVTFVSMVPVIVFWITNKKKL